MQLSHLATFVPYDPSLGPLRHKRTLSPGTGDLSQSWSDLLHMNVGQTDAQTMLCLSFQDQAPMVCHEDHITVGRHGCHNVEDCM